MKSWSGDLLQRIWGNRLFEKNDENHGGEYAKAILVKVIEMVDRSFFSWGSIASVAFL